MELRNINIEGLDKYQITPDGMVYNTKTKRWIKPYITEHKYYSYALTSYITNKRKNYLAHRLVAYTYIGNPEFNNLEVDHIDEDKANNHFSNLQWITHSENIHKSFKLGKRTGYWKNKTRPSPAIGTIQKMANAKFKPMKIYRYGKYINTFESVQKTADYFNISRVYVYLIMKNGGFYKEYKLEFC